MIKSEKRISVAILNYNGEKYLKKFLPSIINFTDKKISSIYVIDNNSSDNSILLIKQKFPSIKVILNKKNYGYAKGYNVGLKNIKSDYIVLINNDVEVSKNWLIPMFNSMEQNNKIGSCQPKILSYENRTSFEYAGASGGYIDFLGYPYCRGRIFDTIELDKGQYDTSMEIFWSSGACMMIRNKLFKKLGGFDESFYAHMEEIDLCWRIKRLGLKNFCFPKSKVYHVGGGTLNYNNPKKTFLNFRNNLIMLFKNESLISLTIKFPIRLLFDLFSIFYFMISKRSLAHPISIIRAYFNIILKIPLLIFKSRNIIARDKNEDRIIIPIEYYLKGKSRYCDL